VALDQSKTLLGDFETRISAWLIAQNRAFIQKCVSEYGDVRRFGVTKSTSHMTKTELTAAESYVLLQPNEDNSRKALRLLLKEATLRGYVRCYRGIRMLPTTLAIPIGLLLGFLCFIFLIQNPFGFVAGLLLGGLVGYFMPGPDKRSAELMLLIPTAEGLEHLSKSKSDRSPLVYVLLKISEAQQERYQNCSFDELLAAIKQDTPSGSLFLDEKIISPLVRRGLLNVQYGDKTALEARLASKKKAIQAVAKSQGRKGPEAEALRKEYRRLRDMPCNRYSLTAAGEAEQKKIQAAVQSGQNLPRLMRESPQAAGALAFSLGALMLLVPDLEGRFGDLLHLTNLHLQDGPWDDYLLSEKPQQPDGSGSGDSGSGYDEPEDGGSDWDDGTDHLDGGMDGLDSDFTSDSMDSGGDGGDGGCDGGGCGGDGGGCGGCGGGD
jgi:hypothetical protein